MGTNFNRGQAEKMADFFFDIGKGTLLGGVGFALTGTSAAVISLALVSAGLASACVMIALALLEPQR